MTDRKTNKPEDRLRSVLAKTADLAKRSGAPGKNPGWFDRHFQWRKFLEDEVFGRTTFAPRSAWDYLGYTGTMALVLLALQFVSGLLLLLYYVPEPGQAFASVQRIRNEVPFGFLYSNFHAISAKLLLVLLFIHMFRAMIISAHRGPREPQWYGGVLLLTLALLAGFSGYLLPWSQQSYWAGVIGTEALRTVPLVGDLLVSLVRGGEGMSGATLHRFFALHVTLLPLCFLVLLWVHLKRVWATGVIAPPGASAHIRQNECIGCGKCEAACLFHAVKMTELVQAALEKTEGDRPVKVPRVNQNLCNACRACEKVCPTRCIFFASDRGPLPTEPIFPDHLIRRLKGVMTALLVLFFSVFFLHGLILEEKIPADALVTPEKIKPDWYFLAAYQALRWLPGKGLGLAVLVGILLLLFFLPALDRTGSRDFRHRPVYLFLVLAGIAAFIVFTIRGYF